MMVESISSELVEAVDALWRRVHRTGNFYAAPTFVHLRETCQRLYPSAGSNGAMNVALGQTVCALGLRRRLGCDVWARELLTVKLAEFAQAHSHDYQEICAKRATSIALAAIIVHAITPSHGHWGTSDYPPITSKRPYKAFLFHRTRISGCGPPVSSSAFCDSNTAQ